MNKGRLKSKNKIMLITLGAIAAALVVIAAIGTAAGGGQETVPTVETVAVKKGSVTQEVDASGTVESEIKKTFFSPVNGEIQTMNAQVGDTVQAGTGIIGFNLEALEEENQKAEMNVRSGQLDLQDARQQASEAQAKVADAQARIPELEAQIQDTENWIADLKQQIADAQTNAQNDAQAQLEQAQAEAAAAYEADLANFQNQTLPEYEQNLAQAEETMYNCQEALNKAEEDYGNEKITVEEYSDKEKEYQQAQQAFQDLRSNPPAQPNQADYAVSPEAFAGAADTSELESQLETATSDLAQLQSDLASQKAIAEADTGGLTQAAQDKMQISNNLAELEAKSLQELLEEGRKGIQAEFKGVISDAKVTQGAQVTQGMELFTLQSTEQVSVNANISKYDFDKVKEGQKAVVTLGDSEYQGTVKKISKIAIANEKGNPMIGVTVHIDNPDDNIFIGVDAKVSILAAQAENVPLLPVEVVNIGKDGSFCYVVKDGVIQKQNIETGVTSDSYVEVKSGLKEGDAVIRDIADHEEGDQVTAKEAAQ